MPREAARDHRTFLLWFLTRRRRWRGNPSSPSTGANSKEAGKGTVVAALPFIPTIVGTDTYTDKLWAD